jgi:hypothetical protein
MSESEWTTVPGAARKRCKFCFELVYWKPQARRLDAYGNVLHDPPREARLSADGGLEYRDAPHKCKRQG